MMRCVRLSDERYGDRGYRELRQLPHTSAIFSLDERDASMVVPASSLAQHDRERVFALRGIMEAKSCTGSQEIRNVNVVLLLKHLEVGVSLQCQRDDLVACEDTSRNSLYVHGGRDLPEVSARAFGQVTPPRQLLRTEREKTEIKNW